MDLSKLFEAQRRLDTFIEKEKGLEGQDLLDKKILALQVELGELAQNWRGFKFWSEDQEPNTSLCKKCSGKGQFIGEGFEIYNPCPWCDGDGVGEQNPLLEEYVDCLHFILSIGNEFDCKDLTFTDFLHREDNITKQFNYVFYTVMSINERIVCNDYDDMEECYGYLLGGFVELGKQLGFTWDEIEKAYFEKHKTNFERQRNGY